MLEFAHLTGLEPVSSHPKRYLWTDAYAVCNFLELYRQMKDRAYLGLALRLIDQVHHTLGRHREDDPRHGWISGLGEEEGKQYPTISGLRIGKMLNERKSNEPQDERLEWDQDGQYYHYLTKWMHALHRATLVTGDPIYLRWAMEMAKAAHAGFTHKPSFGGRKRMYWKMSIDLSYPLVTSMGQHDPLDGFVTYSELQAAAGYFKDSSLPDLHWEIKDMADICQGMGTNLATSDPLGTGGLLSDSLRIAQLIVHEGYKYSGLLSAVVDSAQIGVEAFVGSRTNDYPAEYRLAFREFGISIGLSAVADLSKLVGENPGLFSQEGKQVVNQEMGQDGNLPRQVKDLMSYMPLRDMIEEFWMDSKNRGASTWTEHREINMTMLATSLAPKGFLITYE